MPKKSKLEVIDSTLKDLSKKWEKARGKDKNAVMREINAALDKRNEITKNEHS